MEEIIYLEPDEEITSVIDKIKNTKGSSIGLVVPRNATILQSVVNLKLISKEAVTLGKQIAIVTADKIGRNLAAQVGLSVYNSVKEEKPVMSPAMPKVAHDEILEIDESDKLKVTEENIEDNDEEKSESESDSFKSTRMNVHHFQEDRPIIRWKAGERPVIQKNGREKEVEAESVRAVSRQIERKTKKLIWPFLLIILILSGVAFYLLYPVAQVNIFVKATDLKKTVPVIFTNTITVPSLAQNTFPSVLIEGVATDDQKFPATGQKNSGGKATGTVTFYNSLDSLSHKYPVGTKLIASNKTYLTTSAVAIPGASVSGGQLLPGQVTGTIEAEAAGEDYNIKVAKLTIVGLAANQQSLIYAQTNGDLKGGFTKVVQVVSADDYNNALKKMTDSLAPKLDQDLQTKSAGLTMIDKSLVAPDPEVTSSSNVDQEATEFEMKVAVKKQIMAYNYTQFSNYLTQTLTSQVDAGKMVAIASANDLAFTIDKQAYDHGELDTSILVNAKIATKISSDVVKTNILGKSKSSAEKYILSQPDISRVTFEFRPSFWQNISYLNHNVKVVISYIAE